MTKSFTRADRFVMICHGSDCKKGGAKKLTSEAKKLLKAEGAFKTSRIIKMRCTGHCKRAPICGLLPANTWLEKTSKSDLRDALIEDLARGDHHDKSQ